MAQKRDERDELKNAASANTRRESMEREASAMRTTDEEVRVPVVEEELQIGKRAVETGGVRVHTGVTETPVREDVRLHEEHVNVERRPVNRELRPEDMKAFQEGTIEMREMAEEAVVAKKARVVEEVVVGKQATERTEHISDTVRRTDVEIEPLSGANTRAGFDRLESSCRTHYNQNFATSGYGYDDYSPAYRYGYDLANGGNSSWSSIENDVQKSWESRNKGTWDKFKDAIRYGFENGR
jgi:uncharacterized protein (TIGR02271 family)